MLLPVLIDLIQDDGPAQRFRNLAAFRFIGLLEIHGQVQHPLSVGNRNGNVLIHGSLLLVHLLDDGVHLLHQGIHSAVIDLLHMGAKPVGDILRLGVLIEILVEAQVDREGRDDVFLESLVVHAVRLLGDDRSRIGHHVLDINLDAFARQGVAAAGIDSLALVIHHIVILERTLTISEMILFHPFLCRFDRLGQHAGNEGLVIGHSQFVHYPGNPFGPEFTHQVVFQGNVERGGSGIPLTTGTTPQLAVHPAAVMTRRTDDGETTGRLDFRRQLDIGTTASHVGGDGHLAALARLGNDFGFTGVLLRIQDVRTKAAQAHHPGKEFGGFHIRRTYQDRPSRLGQFHYAVNHRVELALLRLINDVVLVVADHRTVGRNGNDIQLIDAPELTRLGFGGTGHTGEFVIHPEIILQGDGGKRLRGRLNLHVFLGFHRLMETVAPAASLHDTAGALVHDLYLVVHNHVVDILLEHRIRLEELDNRMDTLALEGEILHQGIFLLRLFLGAQRSVILDFSDGRTHVRQDEEVRIGNGGSQHLMALVGHVHAVLDLGDDEVKLVRHLRHLPLIILHIVGFRLLQELFHALLGQELDQRLVFRETLVAAQKQLSAFGFVPGGNRFLGLVEGLVHQGALLIVEILHIRTVFHELLVIGRLLHRSGDDQRGTGVVNQHGVHLIDNRIMVLALHEVGHPGRHVVTEVVEAELIVGTERDVTVIRFFPGVGIGLVLVDAVHAESVELIQRSHPFGVSLGQVVVHRHHMHAFSGQRIQEDREGSDQGLTLAGRHLGNAATLLLVRLQAAVQDDTADELHVVMDHVPGDFVAAGNPMVVPDSLVALDAHEVTSGCRQVTVKVSGRHLDAFLLGKTTGRGLDDGEGLRQDLIQALLDRIVLILHQLVGFCGKGFLFRHGNVLLQFRLDLCDTGLERFLHGKDPGTEGRGTCTEFIMGKGIDFGIDRQDLVQDGLDLLHVTVGFGPENLLQYICYCHYEFKIMLKITNLTNIVRIAGLSKSVRKIRIFCYLCGYEKVPYPPPGPVPLRRSAPCPEVRPPAGRIRPVARPPGRQFLHVFPRLRLHAGPDSTEPGERNPPGRIPQGRADIRPAPEPSRHFFRHCRGKLPLRVHPGPQLQRCPVFPGRTERYPGKHPGTQAAHPPGFAGMPNHPGKDMVLRGGGCRRFRIGCEP